VLVSSGTESNIRFYVKSNGVFNEIDEIRYFSVVEVGRSSSKVRSTARTVDLIDTASSPLVLAAWGANDSFSINIHAWNNPVPVKRIVYHTSIVVILRALSESRFLSLDNEGYGLFSVMPE
jgi:hypothetical protein